MKKPDFPCICFALFALMHVYFLVHDDAGNYLSRMESPRAEICWAIAFLGSYFGARAWIRPYGNDDVPAAGTLVALGYGSAIFRSFL